MTRIVCGWCSQPAPDVGPCLHCGRDAALPWRQRAKQPPEIRTDAVGRPALDRSAVRRRLAAARQALEDEGTNVTVEALAERLDVSPRTIRRWQQMAAS